ncbi:MAG: polysaccharide biosynthesis tyrosine autokinase [Elusimicrobia bacterium]|nr:polysaccharide biosynthesis tyrosine autokinase [Elusimicrobiota bacterium]
MSTIGPHLSDYLHILMRRRWVIITFFVVLVTVVIIGTLKQTPLYQATATVLIERKSPQVVSFQEVIPVGADSYYQYQDYYETQYKLLQSKALMERVAQKLGMFDTDDADDKNPVQALLNTTTITPVKNSQLVNVSAESNDPGQAMSIANTVTEEFIQQNLERNMQASTQAAEWLSNRIEEQRKKIKNSEMALQQYRKENNINILPQVTGELAIEDIKSEYAKLQSLQANYEQRYTDKHPKMIELKAQIKSLQNKIQGLEDTDKGNTAIEYRVLEREVQTNKAMYEILLTRLKEIDLSRSLNMNNIAVVDPASLPEKPVKPNVKLNIALAILIGLIGGIGLAFFIDYLDRTIKSPQDIKELLESHFLGSIPSIVGDNIVKKDQIVYYEPQSPISEAYRIIRTEILHLLPQNETGKALLITSGEPQSGKTITVSNLGIAFSQKGSRVVLVDGDLRRPQLHKIFNLDRYNGFSDFLSGEKEINEIIKPSGIDSLSVITSGKVPHYPAEIIGSGHIEGFIQNLKKQFDIIIFDSPPVVSVTDSVIFADKVDAIVQVVRSGKAMVPISLRVKEQLSRAKAKILGIILNDLQTYHDNYYYYRYYRYYAETHASSKRSSALGRGGREPVLR